MGWVTSGEKSGLTMVHLASAIILTSHFPTVVAAKSASMVSKEGVGGEPETTSPRCCLEHATSQLQTPVLNSQTGFSCAVEGSVWAAFT